MTRTAFAALALSAAIAASPAQAQDQGGQEVVKLTDEQTKAVGEILNDQGPLTKALDGAGIDPTSQIWQAAANYSATAKGFWLNEKCHFVPEEMMPGYRGRMKFLTNIVGSLLMQQGGLSQEDAGNRITLLQTTARDDMEARESLGCGIEARTIVGVSVNILGRLKKPEAAPEAPAPEGTPQS